MDKAVLTSLQATVTTGLLPTSMLAFIRQDAPAGWSLLLLAVASGACALRNLSPKRSDERLNR